MFQYLVSPSLEVVKVGGNRSKRWQNEWKDWGVIHTFIIEKYSTDVLKAMGMFALQLNNSNWPEEKNNDSRYLTISEAIEDKDFKKLKAFLDKDKGRESPSNLLYLLRFFTDVVVNTYDREAWKDEKKQVVIEMALTTTFPFPPEMITSNILLPPDQYGFLLKAMRKINLMEFEKSNYPKKNLKPITKSVANEIEKLIEGYGLYLEKLETGGGSKKSICLDIEKEIGVNNVRQEFNRYDGFFEKLTNHVQRKHPKFILDPETVKVIMEFCFNRAKAL